MLDIPDVFDFSKPFGYFEAFSTMLVVLLLFLFVWILLSNLSKNKHYEKRDHD